MWIEEKRITHNNLNEKNIIIERSERIYYNNYDQVIIIIIYLVLRRSTIWALRELLYPIKMVGRQ